MTWYLSIGLALFCSSTLVFAVTPSSVSIGQITGYTVRYPSAVTVPPAISNEAYSTLPGCPAPPVCPGINSSYTPTAACPDYCTVTRISSPPPPALPQAAGQFLGVTATVDAVCPAGYVQVALYNLQPQIIQHAWDNAFPIPDMATYNRYVSNGYGCALDPGTTHFVNYGNGNAIYPGGWFCSQPTCGWCNVPNDPQYPFGQLTVNSGAFGSGVMQFTAGYVAAASGGTPFCWSTGTGCPDGWGLVSCGVWHKLAYVHNTYMYMRCTPPATTMIYTNNYIPVSIVCARQKLQWAP